MKQTRSFQRIDVDTARALLTRADVLLLDSRDPASFTLAHIHGARRLGSDNLDTTLLGTPKPTAILLYCYHGNASQTYGQMFADFGFQEVYSLDGGFAAWQRAHKKQNPPSLSQGLMQWLARHGYPANALDAVADNGITPLMRAAKEGAIATVFQMLQAGAELNATNHDGNNALWLACVGASLDTMDVLIRAGIDLDHQNDAGATCLMYAASTGKHAVVEKLLSAGANFQLQSQDDFTALDMASTLECLQLLRGVEKRLAANAV